MHIFLAASALIAVASAASIAPIIIIPSSNVARGPPDSAIVQSERLGNGFAYSIAEAQGIESVQSLGVLSPWDTLPLITTLTGQPIVLTTVERIGDDKQKQERTKTTTEDPESEPVDVTKDETRPDETQVKSRSDLTNRSTEDGNETRQKDNIKSEAKQRTDERENTREQLKEKIETGKRERLTDTNEKTRKQTTQSE